MSSESRTLHNPSRTVDLRQSPSLIFSSVRESRYFTITGVCSENPTLLALPACHRAESIHYRRLIITGRMDLALHQIVKRRGISKAVARRLAEHFRVSVELFV